MSEIPNPISEWTIEELDARPRIGQELVGNEMCMWNFISGKQELTLEEQKCVDRMRERYGEL